MRDGSGENSLGERWETAGLFGDSEEAVGVQQAAVRMSPAYERLDTGDQAAAELEFGLVVQHELVRCCYSRSDLCSHDEPASSVGAVFDVVDLDARASGFGGVHRDISALVEVFGVAGIGGVPGDSDASADSNAHVVELERSEQSLADTTGSLHGCILVGSREQDSELVAAESAERVALTQHRRQSLSDLLQESVTHLMAEQIVDVFESIEIEQQHSTSRSGGRGCEEAIKSGGECSPIRQTSEVVGGGLTPCFDEVTRLMKGNDRANECHDQCCCAEADGVDGYVDYACGDEDHDSEQAGHDRHCK